MPCIYAPAHLVEPVTMQASYRETTSDLCSTYLLCYYLTVSSGPFVTNYLNMDILICRMRQFLYLDHFILHGMCDKLQPDDVMLLLEWTLKAGCLSRFSTIFSTLPAALRPSSEKLLDLLEVNKAHINYRSVSALQTLLGAQQLSAKDFISALERFTSHSRMCQVLSSLPAAAALDAANLLQAMRSALGSGNTQLVRNLCNLPAAQAVAAAELVPYLVSAAADGDEDAVATFRHLLAAQKLLAADVASAMMSAAAAGALNILKQLCSLSAAQQLSGAQLTAVLTSAVSTGLEYISFLFHLPAAQQLSPVHVAAVLHLVIEGRCVWVPAWELWQLPGAKQMGPSQVQGLLEAAQDAVTAVSVQLSSRYLIQWTESAAEDVLTLIERLPAACG